MRWDFWFSCSYCSIAESEATGIGYQIDHYRPVSRHSELENAYYNLMWSCQPCNRQKGPLDPSDDDRKAGRYILRPDEDDFLEHVQLESDELRGLSTPGNFTIECLTLNRNSLRRIRQLRRQLGNAQDTITNGLRELGKALIDHMPRGDRPEFLRDRRDLENAGNTAKAVLAVALRRKLRSDLLDPDPVARDRTARRRTFLKQMKAIVPDVGDLPASSTPSAEPPSAE